MTFGQFYNTKSIIHELDPRTKFIFLIIFGTQIFFIKSFLTYFFIIISIFFLVYMSNVPIKLFLKSMKNILSLILFTSLLNIFFISRGSVILKFLFFKITDYGLNLSLLTILRIFILTFLTSILTFTTSPLRLTDAFVNILCPFKKFLPINEISIIFSIAMRFIPVLSEELRKIKQAQTMRGINFRSKNIFELIKNYLSLLLPIFISTLRRADDLALAMEARCYNPYVKRNSLKKLKFKTLDFSVLALVFIFFILSVLSNYFFRSR